MWARLRSLLWARSSYRKIVSTETRLPLALSGFLWMGLGTVRMACLPPRLASLDSFFFDFPWWSSSRPIHSTFATWCIYKIDWLLCWLTSHIGYNISIHWPRNLLTSRGRGTFVLWKNHALVLCRTCAVSRATCSALRSPRAVGCDSH